MDISMTTLGIGAAVGFVAGAWRAVVSFGQQLTSVVVVTSKFENQSGYAVLMYLMRNGRCLFCPNPTYTGLTDYVRPNGRTELIALWTLGSEGGRATYWRLEGRIVAVKAEWGSVSITYIRGAIQPDDLVQKSIQLFNSEKADSDGHRFFVRRMQGSIGDKTAFIKMAKSSDAEEAPIGEGSLSSDRYTARPVGWSVYDIGQPVEKDGLNRLELPVEVVAACEDCRRWLIKREWFIDHGVPWRLGLGFVGPPGSGKTATARALGQSLDLPIFMIDLRTMTGNDLIDAWNGMMAWTPCIALFEDIHTVFDREKYIVNTGQEAGLSFGTLLNVLDGVESTDGVLSIITTNDYQMLSTALGGPDEHGKAQLRPGRVNSLLHFSSLTKDQQIRMAARILPELSDQDRQELVDNNLETTGAQFQEVCRLAASENW